MPILSVARSTYQPKSKSEKIDDKLDRIELTIRQSQKALDKFDQDQVATKSTQKLLHQLDKAMNLRDKLIDANGKINLKLFNQLQLTYNTLNTSLKDALEDPHAKRGLSKYASATGQYVTEKAAGVTETQGFNESARAGLAALSPQLAMASELFGIDVGNLASKGLKKTGSGLGRLFKNSRSNASNDNDVAAAVRDQTREDDEHFQDAEDNTQKRHKQIIKKLDELNKTSLGISNSVSDGGG